MEFLNASDLPSCEEMRKDNTVIVLQDGKLRLMPMSEILTYLAGAQIETDATLKNEGMAADAAAVREFVNGRLVADIVMLPSASWADNTQTVTVKGMTKSNTETSAIVAPVPDDDNFTAYTENGVRCTAQGDGTLTFSCTSIPDTDLSVNVLIKK